MGRKTDSFAQSERGGITSSKSRSIAAYVILGCTALFFLFYIFGPARYSYHSDTTDSMMWAHAALDAGGLVNADFYYAIFLLFNGHLLMVPFIAVFGFGILAQQLGMAVFILLFIWSFYTMLRVIGWERLSSASTVAILMFGLSVSEKSREIFLDHVFTYSFSMFLLAVGMILVVKSLRASSDGKRFLLYAGLSGLWFFLGSLNRLESVTLFVVPLIGGLVGERFLAARPFENERKKTEFFLLTAIIGVLSLLGIAVAGLVTKNLYAGYESAYSSFSASDQWMGQAEKLLPYWMTYLGVDPLAYVPMGSVEGVILLLRIAVNLLLVAAPVVLLFLYRKITSRGERILILAHWVMSALILLAFVFGRIGNANWRLSPIACTSIVLTCVLIRWIYQHSSMRRVAVVLLAPILLSCLLAMADVASLHKEDYPVWTKRQELIAFLQENELDYGYATFWNANIITMESDSAVRVRNVKIESNLFEPYRYQTRASWYEDQPGQEEYFILATTAEYNLLKTHEAELLKTANRTLTCGNYYIVVFSENVF